MYTLIKKDDILLGNNYSINLSTIKILLFNYSSFLSFFPFLLSYYLYFLSLEKCMSGEIVCSRKINWIQKKITQSILSSIFLGILIELIILKLITKLNFIHFILFLIIIYNYSHGESFYDHGLYNFSGCIIIIIATIIILIPFNILLYLKKKKE